MAVDGKLIKRAREARDKSQAWLADKIGTDQTYISKLERNKLQGGIKGHELLILAHELRFDPYVFSGDVPFERGDLVRNPRRDDLADIREMMVDLHSRVAPITKTADDEKLSERMLANAQLRDLVETLQFWDGAMIRKFAEWARAFSAGIDYGEDRAKEAHLGGAEEAESPPAGQQAG